MFVLYCVVTFCIVPYGYYLCLYQNFTDFVKFLIHDSLWSFRCSFQGIIFVVPDFFWCNSIILFIYYAFEQCSENLPIMINTMPKAITTIIVTIHIQFNDYMYNTKSIIICDCLRKPSLTAHLVFREIPFWNIEATSVLLFCDLVTLDVLYY